MIKKIVYIIPGLGEHSKLVRYQNLIQKIKKSKYSPEFVDIDWSKPISKQIFIPKPNSIIFGFSLGAVLAYLITKKYKCDKVIFGSMTNLNSYSKKFLQDFFSKEFGVSAAKNITEDLKGIKISLTSLKIPFITMAGENENLKADILVPKTNHYISKAYIDLVIKNIKKPL